MLLVSLSVFYLEVAKSESVTDTRDFAQEFTECVLPVGEIQEKSLKPGILPMNSIHNNSSVDLRNSAKRGNRKPEKGEGDGPQLTTTAMIPKILIITEKFGEEDLQRRSELCIGFLRSSYIKGLQLSNTS